MRYCERTIRRSSSCQRGSRLRERSIAPPVVQKRFQCCRAARRVSSNVGQGLRCGRRRESDHRLERLAAVARSEDERVLLLLDELGFRGPGEPDVVAVVVETPVEGGARRRLPDDPGLVRVRPGPVRGGGRSRAVGEAEADGDPPEPHEPRDDANRDEVEGRVAQSLHRDRLAFDPEAAAQDAVPQVEGLLDVGEIVARRRPAVPEGEAEADAAEVQPVRVGAEPLDLGRPPVAGNVGVADRATVRVELREPEALDREALRVGGGVPAPLRERAERDRLVVGLGERLEARSVGGEGELAVPDRQGRLRVEGPQHGLVAIHQGVPVDREGRGGGPGAGEGGGEGQGQAREPVETGPPHQETSVAAKAGVLMRAAAPRSRGCSPRGTLRSCVSPASRRISSSRRSFWMVGRTRSHTAVISPPT